MKLTRYHQQFAIILPHESALRADDGSVPYFPICQRTLPRQPKNVERNEKVMRADCYYLHYLHQRLKTNWNITICMCALIAAMIRPHLHDRNSVGFWPVPHWFNAQNKHRSVIGYLRLPGGSMVMFRYYLIGSDTAAPSGLYARLCHAFLVYYLF